MTGQSENKDLSQAQAQAHTCWDSGIPQDSAHCSQEPTPLSALSPSCLAYSQADVSLHHWLLGKKWTGFPPHTLTCFSHLAKHRLELHHLFKCCLIGSKQASCNEERKGEGLTDTASWRSAKLWE